jgi:hypothetical protein
MHEAGTRFPNIDRHKELRMEPGKTSLAAGEEALVMVVHPAIARRS